MLIQDLSSVQSLFLCLKFVLQQKQTVFSDFLSTSKDKQVSLFVVVSDIILLFLLC